VQKYGYPEDSVVIRQFDQQIDLARKRQQQQAA
jgi:hypothetical protein